MWVAGLVSGSSDARSRARHASQGSTPVRVASVGLRGERACEVFRLTALLAYRATV